MPTMVPATMEMKTNNAEYEYHIGSGSFFLAHIARPTRPSQRTDKSRITAHAIHAW